MRYIAVIRNRSTHAIGSKLDVLTHTDISHLNANVTYYLQQEGYSDEEIRGGDYKKDILIVIFVCDDNNRALKLA